MQARRIFIVFKTSQLQAKANNRKPSLCKNNARRKQAAYSLFSKRRSCKQEQANEAFPTGVYYA